MELTMADKYALAGLIPALLLLVGVVLGLQFIAPVNVAAYIWAGVLITAAFYTTFLILVNLHHVKK